MFLNHLSIKKSILLDPRLYLLCTYSLRCISFCWDKTLSLICIVHTKNRSATNIDKFRYVETNPGPQSDSLMLKNAYCSVMHLTMGRMRHKLSYIVDHCSDVLYSLFYRNASWYISNSKLIVNTQEYNVQDLTSRSGGLIIYVPKLLILKTTARFGVSPNLCYRSSTFLLCNVYRSPNMAVNVWDYVKIALETTFESNPSIIVIDDLNQGL